MKKCPACAEEIQDVAVKCRHCGTDLAAIFETVANEKAARSSQKALGIFFGILGAALLGGCAYREFAAGHPSKGLIAVGFGVAFLIVGPVASWIGDVFRRFAKPDMVFASGAVDMAGKKVFWSVGPQAISAFLAFCCMFVLMDAVTADKDGLIEAKSAAAENVQVSQAHTAANSATALQVLADASSNVPTISETLTSAAEQPRAIPSVAVEQATPAQEQKMATVVQTAAYVPTVPQVSEPARIEASFDCAKAAAKIEKLICASPETAAADKRLAVAYIAARAKSTDVGALKVDQAAWLRQDRSVCADAACLLKAIESRIQKLEAP